jgi:hypothetical protein
MIARIAVWQPMPTDDRTWVAAAAKDIPGVVAGYHLIDPETGDGLSVSIFEDAQALAATKAAIDDRAAAIGWHDHRRPAPAKVTIYDVLRSTP